MASVARRRWVRLAAILAGVVAALQFVPIDRTNPPVTSEIHASAAVDAVLRRSCYDCHSNETVWPWYSRVAPISFVVSRDVHQGRHHLNFSTWGEYDSVRQAKSVREIWKQVSTGEMPMSIYLPFHPHARLGDPDKAALEAWAKSVAAANPSLSSEPDDHDHDH
jgi:Haem-binding domain